MTNRLFLFGPLLLILLPARLGNRCVSADPASCRALGEEQEVTGSPQLEVRGLDAERAANQRVFQEVYQREREALFARHAGAWVAIAGGELLPRDAKGRVAPAAKLEDVLRAAEVAAPGARQRFVFRIGEEGDVRYRPTINGHAEWIGRSFFPHVAGVVWVTPDGVYSASSGTEPEQGIRLGGGELDELGPRATLAVSSDPDVPARELSFVVSTGFEGYATFGRENGEALGLSRYEIPGALHLDGMKSALRRARAHFQLDDELLDAWLPVGVRVDGLSLGEDVLDLERRLRGGR